MDRHGITSHTAGFLHGFGAAALALVVAAALATSWACNEPTSDEGGQAPTAVASMDTDPVTEEAGRGVRRALARADAMARMTSLAVTLRDAAPADLPAIRDAFDDPGIAPSPIEDAVFAAWWSGFDPAGAYEWVLDARPSPASLAAIFEQWGMADPRTAAAVLAGQGTPSPGGVPAPLRKDAKVGLLRGWLDSGEPGLVSYLSTVATEQGGIPVIEEFGRYLVSRRGADGAVELLSSMPEGQQSVMAKTLFAMARPVAHASPEAGVRLFERYKDDPAAANLLISIAEGWVDARGGESAMTWVLEQRDHPRLRAAVSRVYRRWVRLDHEAAMSWMESRLESIPPELEGALVVFIGYESERDILRALELRKRIRAGLVRRDVTLKLLRDWRRKDADAANKWIDEATTLSDYVRRQLERERDKPQLGLQAERFDPEATEDATRR